MENLAREVQSALQSERESGKQVDRVNELLEAAKKENAITLTEVLLLGATRGGFLTLQRLTGKKNDKNSAGGVGDVVEGPLLPEVALRSRLQSAVCVVPDCPKRGSFEEQENILYITPDSHCPECGGQDFKRGDFVAIPTKIGIVEGTSRENRTLDSTGQNRDITRVVKTDPKTGVFTLPIQMAVLLLRRYGKHIRTPRWANRPKTAANPNKWPMGDRWLVEEPAYEKQHKETQVSTYKSMLSAAT